MYRVDIQNGDDSAITIHSPFTDGEKVIDGTIQREINHIDTFSFDILPNNVGYGELNPFKTKLSVYNTMSGKYEFHGRILESEQSMDSTGAFIIHYLCEGVAGYLHDSQQRHLEFRGSPSELLATIIGYHNQQVEDYKKVTIGTVTVTDPNDYIYHYLSAEQSTWEAIHDKLVSRLGGELEVIQTEAGIVLNYVNEIGTQSNTDIVLARNLVRNTRSVDATEIITRLTPLGERLESEDKDATDASEARLTIESVNNGVPYLDRPDLINEFGIRGGFYTWDDVTQASNLKEKGVAFLNEQKLILNQIDITALDLSLINLDFESFEVGNYHRFVNPIMMIDESLRIVGKVVKLDVPETNIIKIGDKFKTLAEYQRENRDNSKLINDMRRTINSQVSRIGTLSQNLTDAKGQILNIQSTLSGVNINDLPGSLSALSVQLSTLQETIDTLEIPYYDIATTSQNGLMSAEDKSALDKVVMDVGNVSVLATTETSDIVLAINELVGRIEMLEV